MLYTAITALKRQGKHRIKERKIVKYKRDHESSATFKRRKKKRIGIDPGVNFSDPTKTVKCESFTIGHTAWCNESWLQLFHTDGNTGEMDSHAEKCSEALLITVGVILFNLLLSFISYSYRGT